MQKDYFCKLGLPLTAQANITQCKKPIANGWALGSVDSQINYSNIVKLSQGIAFKLNTNND